MVKTDAGRTVYGGGGITSDEKIAPLKNNKFEDEMLIHYAFSDFSRHYLATHTVRQGHDGGRGQCSSSSRTF